MLKRYRSLEDQFIPSKHPEMTNREKRNFISTTKNDLKTALVIFCKFNSVIHAEVKYKIFSSLQLLHV